MTVHLRNGPDEVVVDPGDGRITSWVAGGAERLVTSPPDGTAAQFQWGCFVMAPWVGRIRDARFPWRSEMARLAPRLQGHAIHGLVMDRTWEVTASTANTATLAVRLDDGPWPFTGVEVTHVVRLGAGRLDLQLAVQAGPAPIPVTIGWHPCFARPAAGDVAVEVHADHVLDTDDDNVPTGRVLPVAGPTDLRAGPALGDRRLDTTYVEVGGPVRVTWDDLDLTMDDHGLPTFVVFTPAHEFCVEPQSGWPDAVNLAGDVEHRHGLQIVEPGMRRHWHTTWRWTTRPRRHRPPAGRDRTIVQPPAEVQHGSEVAE